MSGASIGPNLEIVLASVILSVVAFIAGRPATVVCDSTLHGHAVPNVVAWTPSDGSAIYVLPSVCDDASAPAGSPQFAFALGTIVHESAHVRGVKSESCAEMIADIGIYDVLARFYNAPFFSRLSKSIGAQVLAYTRQLPAAYQPEACWANGIR